MSNRYKKYRTPQAVQDYIRTFRKDAIQALRNQGLPKEELKAHQEALEANVDRLKEFLLSQCDTIPPPPLEEPAEAPDDKPTTPPPGDDDEDSWEPEFSLFPKPKPEGGWTW
jgi:hypothetical protein